MRKIFTLSLYFIATAVFFSCSKDEPTPSTPIDILTGGASKSWLIASLKVGGVNELEPCEADDVYTFTKATSKLLIEVGAKKCFTSETNETSDFKLSADGNTITLGGFSHTITKLTATELEYKITAFGQTAEYVLKAK
jgi:hypothetical protein